jgi:hypothetical protein
MSCVGGHLDFENKNFVKEHSRNIPPEFAYACQ